MYYQSLDPSLVLGLYLADQLDVVSACFLDFSLIGLSMQVRPGNEASLHNPKIKHRSCHNLPTVHNEWSKKSSLPAEVICTSNDQPLCLHLGCT